MCQQADLRPAVDEVQLVDCLGLPDATLRPVVDPRKDEVVVEASCCLRHPRRGRAPRFYWHKPTALADDVQTFPRRSPAR